VACGGVFFKLFFALGTSFFFPSMASAAAGQRTMRQTIGSKAPRARKIQKSCLRMASLSTFISSPVRLRILIHRIAFSGKPTEAIRGHHHFGASAVTAPSGLIKLSLGIHSFHTKIIMNSQRVGVAFLGIGLAGAKVAPPKPPGPCKDIPRPPPIFFIMPIISAMPAMPPAPPPNFPPAPPAGATALPPPPLPEPIGTRGVYPPVPEPV